MAKTGRPPTNGAKQGWTLIRNSIVVEAFHKAREGGAKYEFALVAAVEAVNAHDPKMKISTSTVKKILKELMPEDSEEMLKVTKIIEPVITSDGKRSVKTSYGIGFAPRVEYPHPSNRKK